MKIAIEKNRAAFSNYNMVRMREAVRYLSEEKLEIFIKIPVLLHINVPRFPGFIDTGEPCHGIFNFENSGFYKVAATNNSFPKSILEMSRVNSPAIKGLYHIGSLGTFTQSSGSDFDYWVIIDKRMLSREQFTSLEKKLDAIIKYSREDYDQKVSFFIMDQKEIKQNVYAPFQEVETLAVPKIFLKEEFYRTYLMIAGKIPVWSVLPDQKDLHRTTGMNMEGITSQVLSMYDDLIDLGSIGKIPVEDILKGLLWHICKSRSDPVKAVIKSTMIFSCGYNDSSSSELLCEEIKKGYASVGIDDYAADPYKSLFDRVLKFYETQDPKTINLIKNAVFFRLCGYPDVKLPKPDTPKRVLLDKYIRIWNLNKTQITKLLSYSTWSESEKLLLEKTFINHLSQMYNQMVQKTGRAIETIGQGKEKRNWEVLKNKTRERLRKNPHKIAECSTYLKRRNIQHIHITHSTNSWELTLADKNGQKVAAALKQKNLSSALGWIMENQLYRRHTAVFSMTADLKLFESLDTPVDLDKLYMAFQPLKPLSDDCFETDAAWVKTLVLLVYDQNRLKQVEFLISNTWGEVFFDFLEFDGKKQKEEHCNLIARHITQYSNQYSTFFIYQLSLKRDPAIVYLIKKAYNERSFPDKNNERIREKPYLDRL